MKTIHLIAIAGLLLLATSCVATEMNFSPLTDVDKQMIPYKPDDKIRFKNAQGDTLTMTIVRDITAWAVFEEVMAYQSRLVWLKSRTTDERIDLLLDGWYTGCTDITIRIHPNMGDVRIPYDKNGDFSSVVHESLQIDNHIYYDVTEVNGDVQCFYNKTYGLLQVKKKGKMVFVLIPK